VRERELGTFGGGCSFLPSPEQAGNCRSQRHEVVTYYADGGNDTSFALETLDLAVELFGVSTR
jgi:hypothetical protein